MTDRRVIVTGADAAYHRYLMRALRSVRAHDEGRRIALAVLDLGLEPAQRDEAATLADAIVEPGWDYELPDRATLPSHWRAYTARPHLPRHVPSYDTYMWLDADAWIQQGDTVDQFFAAASGNAVAIVPEVHPAYRNQLHARAEFEDVIRAAFASAFGDEAAERLYCRPHLNTGAFALKADAPHWQAWSDALGRALIGHKSRERLAEQCAMNLIVYDEGLPAIFLPPRCNWICHHAAPRTDPASGLLSEPVAPFAPLGIVHETMWSKDPGL
jgi:lipopolysaccharide biosynthesis glycosyltransferase